MKWTKELPTKPGFYWNRKDATDTNPLIWLIADEDGKLVLVWFYKDWAYDPLNESDGTEWAGPINPPQE